VSPPQINSRWAVLCPSCQKKLINPNQPWPIPCETCGHRTHVKCLRPTIKWLVDLDTTIDPNQVATVCQKCFNHSGNNQTLINNIPQASGSQAIDVYRAFMAKRPARAKMPVQSLWGPYRIDPDNFIPAVTKVLDIVHSAGPKLRWAVKLGAWHQVPMTNLGSKEIILPNYFESPNALGRTHQEILDAMTGAAMHEAGHAAYDKAQTMVDAQRRISQTPGSNGWAVAMCLNIVCDYNLERRVLERYPAFRHYFTECHRWSVLDSLPTLVKALTEDGAEDKINVRLAVLVWEMLGPGDLEAAGGVISHKLKWITQKCFSILKYGYQKGLLNTEAGKIKTSRVLYELIRVINPVGYKPEVVVLPPGTTPPVPPTPPQPNQPQPDIIYVQEGSKGQSLPDDIDLPDMPPTNSESEDEPEDSDDVSDAEGQEESAGESGDPGDPGDDGADGADSGTDEGPESQESSSGPGDEETSDTEGSGTGESDEPGTGSSAGEDRTADGAGPDTDGDDSGDDEEEVTEEEAAGDDGHDYGDRDAGQADNTGLEGEDAGTPGPVGQTTGPAKGGKSGSESQADPGLDPFTGKSDLEDDPTRRSNAKKDALDDLSEEQHGQPTLKETGFPDPLTEQDGSFQRSHRQEAEQAANTPPLSIQTVPDYQVQDNRDQHAERIRQLAPVINRLKKILRFRNADWGGQQTGRRSGILTRRHVNRLSTLGSDKVFHKTMPDQTPKVRIALLVDESDSMSGSYDIAAKNAATALIQALHGIRGVKLWCWGYSLNKNPNYNYGSQHTVPTLRPYTDPFHQANPVGIEIVAMHGGTPTGEAMDHAAEVLLKGAMPDEKKVVFIITDGEAGGYVSTATAVRKHWGKVTFVHIGIGNTVDKDIPFYVGPVTDIDLLPDLLSESASEILT